MNKKLKVALLLILFLFIVAVMIRGFINLGSDVINIEKCKGWKESLDQKKAQIDSYSNSVYDQNGLNELTSMVKSYNLDLNKYNRDCF